MSTCVTDTHQDMKPMSAYVTDAHADIKCMSVLFDLGITCLAKRPYGSFQIQFGHFMSLVNPLFRMVVI